ncbi:MAG: flagellar basal body stator protein MotB [Deltaproteobacteria bacterium]|nr:MAG: flagellar basal body stator protein MotB [Deltaproteobacteria bacterium]
MRRSRRRRRDEEPLNRDRWLVSYADFITLLFAFFTTLYAISVMDSEKAERLVQSIRESFGHGVFDLGSVDPGILDRYSRNPTDLGEQLDAAEAREVERTHFNIVERRVRDLSGSQKVGHGISVRRTEEGMVISLADTHFFESGATGLNKSASAAIVEVATLLKDLPNHIRVEGHTDDLPVASAAVASNWYLSASRAVAVLRVLEGAGIPSYRLSASGFADQRPLVSNKTPQGRRMNRRVDLVILRSRMSADDA